MKLIKLVALLIVVLPLNLQANTVSKITRPLSLDGGLYKQISVTCTNFEEPRTIRKEKGQSLWCVGILKEECSSQKVKAAKLSCESDSSSVAKSEKSAIQPAMVNRTVKDERSTQTEKITQQSDEEELDFYVIEAELIEIKQQELDLRRKTLEIEKRKLVNR